MHGEFRLCPGSQTVLATPTLISDPKFCTLVPAWDTVPNRPENCLFYSFGASPKWLWPFANLQFLKLEILSLQNYQEMPGLPQGHP